MRTKDDEFNKFVDELQEQIYQEELQTFSKKVIEEYHHPKNWGKMPEANAQATITGSCGDTQMIFLKIENGVIKKATFFTDGCGPTIACGSMLTKMVIDKPIIEAKRITSKDLLDALDGLPPENEHCALLAVNTLQEALKNFKNHK